MEPAAHRGTRSIRWPAIFAHLALFLAVALMATLFGFAMADTQEDRFRETLASMQQQAEGGDTTAAELLTALWLARDHFRHSGYDRIIESAQAAPSDIRTTQ